jgi:hypothetical protein
MSILPSFNKVQEILKKNSNEKVERETPESVHLLKDLRYRMKCLQSAMRIQNKNIEPKMDLNHLARGLNLIQPVLASPYTGSQSAFTQMSSTEGQNSGANNNSCFDNEIKNANDGHCTKIQIVYSDQSEADTEPKEDKALEEAKTAQISDADIEIPAKRNNATRKDVVCQTVFRYLRNFYILMFKRFSKVK